MYAHTLVVYHDLMAKQAYLQLVGITTNTELHRTADVDADSMLSQRNATGMIVPVYADHTAGYCFPYHFGTRH